MSKNRPLWAPWRIEFIRGEKEDRCFLCSGREPADTPEESLMIHRAAHSFVIANRFPYNSGHLLIAPYRHAARLSELEPAERAELMELAAKAESVLDAVMKPAAYNVGFNLGAAAGAGVADHLHLHIVPRWVGDTNFMPVLADTRCVPEAIENTAALIRDHWN